VTGVVTFILYCLYTKYILFAREKREGGMEPEQWLVLALYTSPLIPAAVLLFGWSSQESVHWIVPVIATGLFLPGTFIFFQCSFLYL
jgi:MFS transporter, DHA1 family, multidrug resistance protein